MWVFINCDIENPTFGGPEKEKMTFGFQRSQNPHPCKPSKTFKDNVAKRCGIVEAVLAWAEKKAESDAAKHIEAKKKKRLHGIPELHDANDAGTEKSPECTLILAAGNAAKTLAAAGLDTIGRDAFGVLPLNDQLLSIANATYHRIRTSGAINKLISAIGLEYDKQYSTPDDFTALRYGKLMIMTDLEDQYGTRIKGTILNKHPVQFENTYINSLFLLSICR